MRLSLIYCFIILVSNSAHSQILPIDYDTLVRNQEYILSGTGDYSGSAIQRDITGKFLFTGGSLDDVKDASFDRHRGVNRLGFEASSELEFRGYNVKLFKSKDWGLVVRAGYHAFGGMVYSKDLFGMAFYGNLGYVGDTVQMSGTDVTFVNYQKIGFGLINNKSKANVTFNVYNISNRFNGHFRSLDLIQSDDGQEVTLVMDGEVDLKQNLKFNQGIGFGFDLDFKLPVELKSESPAYIQFLVKNIGVGYMYEKQRRYSADTTFTFTGLRFDEIMGDNSILNDSIDILDTIGVASSEVNPTFLLPGFIQVAKIIDNQSPKTIEPFFGVRLYPTLIYAPYVFGGVQWKANDKFAFGGNVSYGGFSGFKAGVYTHMRFNKFSAGISTENLIGFFTGRSSGQSLYLRLRCAL